MRASLHRFAIALGMLLASCGPVPSVSMDACAVPVSMSPERASLRKFDNLQLRVSICSEEPSITTELTWSSSDSSIASVNNLGFVQTRNVGTATITVVAERGTTQLGSAMTVLTITPYAETQSIEMLGPPTVPVGNMASYSLLSLNADQSREWITAAGSWTSSNTSVATVERWGVLTAIAPGTIMLTATYRGHSAALPVVVTP